MIADESAHIWNNLVSFQFDGHGYTYAKAHISLFSESLCLLLLQKKRVHLFVCFRAVAYALLAVLFRHKKLVYALGERKTRNMMLQNTPVCTHTSGEKKLLFTEQRIFACHKCGYLGKQIKKKMLVYMICHLFRKVLVISPIFRTWKYMKSNLFVHILDLLFG